MAALAGKKGPLHPARRSRVAGSLDALGSGIFGRSLTGGEDRTLLPPDLEVLTLEVGAGRPKG